MCACLCRFPFLFSSFFCFLYFIVPSLNPELTLLVVLARRHMPDPGTAACHLKLEGRLHKEYIALSFGIVESWCGKGFIVLVREVIAEI